MMEASLPSALPAVALLLDIDGLVHDFGLLVHVDDLVVHDGLRVVLDDGQRDDQRDDGVLLERFQRFLEHNFGDFVVAGCGVLHEARQQGNNEDGAQNTHCC